MPSFIDDNYEVNGYVAPSTDLKSGENIHEGISFTYRMAARSEMSLLDNKVAIATKNDHNDPKCAGEAEKLACEFVAAHIKSWDLKNSKAEPVAITKENSGRIHPVLFNRVYRMIRGLDVSDKRSDGEEVTPSSEAAEKN